MDSVTLPFKLGFDTREILPYTFTNMRADAKHGNRPLIVPVERITLQQGDYSIVGHTDQIALERKSIADLYGTLTRGRERFIRELERLAELPHSFVLVEGTWRTIIEDRPEQTRANPKSILGSIIALQQRFPKTHWVMGETRLFCEWYLLRVLWRWWIDNVENSPATSTTVDTVEVAE